MKKYFDYLNYVDWNNMNDSIEFANDEPPKVTYEQYVTRMVIDVSF